VTIQHEGARPFAADLRTVTFYNKGQRYRREAIAPQGDRCDWFRVDRALALETARELDPGAQDRPERPFRFSHGPSDAASYLAQRELFQRLAAGAPVDALGVEEAVVGLLGRVLWQAQRAWRAVEPPDAGTPRADAELVERARHALADGLEPVSMASIAQQIGVSQFRLCRVFRRRMGTTLHAYREQLRLRAALEALASPRVDLTDLALSLGYSSHSHFTANFRRAFGVTPSVVRGRAPRTASRYLG
jgi:AraC-like DNA-binding protein